MISISQSASFKGVVKLSCHIQFFRTRSFAWRPATVFAGVSNISLMYGSASYGLRNGHADGFLLDVVGISYPRAMLFLGRLVAVVTKCSHIRSLRSSSIRAFIAHPFS